nr:hypothetical protein [Lysinibacillus timonensis]
MGLYISTVLGFFALIMVSLAMFVHYLRVGLDSHSSVKIDPKPTNEKLS